MRRCGALCDHPYLFCFLCSYKSTVGVRRALSTWAEVGSTELQSVASAHLPTVAVSMGFRPPATSLLSEDRGSST